MNEVVYKKHLFSSREFMLLSAYAGMKQVPVLFYQEPEPMNEKEMNLTIFQLYQKGVLRCEEGNTCTVETEVRSMLRTLKYAEYILKIYSRNHNSPLLCFIYQNVLITELSVNEHDTIKLYMLSKAEFLQELMEQAIVPRTDSQGMNNPDMENGCETLSEFLQQISDAGSRQLPKDEVVEALLDKNENFVTGIIVSDVRLEQNRGVFFILDCGIFDGYVSLDGRIAETGCFTMERLEQFLEL